MQEKSLNNSYWQMRTALLKQRYFWKDQQGQVVETEEQMFRRVANAIAVVEFQYGASDSQVKATTEDFYRQMAQGKFLPNSPTLMNAGRKDGMLNACFVMPVGDSVDQIFTTVKNTATIQKAGGGTGFDFSSLRPTGDLVASSGGTTSGPISFWRVLAETTTAIQQGAHRRGANMGMMDIEHPDILKFILAKQDLAAFGNFNISVKVTDSFMKALRDDPDRVHILINPRDKKQYLIPKTVDLPSYRLQDLRPIEGDWDNCYTVGDVWEMIIKSAHATGEPGVCYIDVVNRYDSTPHIGRIKATNPCGEQPLHDYESCNLGSIDVSKFVTPYQKDMDWEALAPTVRCGVRFLDNVIDANHWPIPEVKEATLGNRRIGLGIMGFADALVALGVRYNSQDAVTFARRLTKVIQSLAHGASEELARERGCFPNFKDSTWDVDHHRPMRNASVITIAPTGSLSIIAGCNGGIEPIYSLCSKRRALDGQEFIHLHPVIEKLGTEQGWLSEKVRNRLVQGIPPKDISEIPPKISKALVTAHEVEPEWHVRIQAGVQEFTDNAVSKTVNLPSKATVEDVDRIYQLAYDLGAKGSTVYRDGCRENQVITAAHQGTQAEIGLPSPRRRPKKTSGTTIKSKTGCGSLFITLNSDEEGLFEIFTNLGKAGGCPSQSEATARILSVALRSGVEPEVLIEQLKGIRCLSTVTRRKANKDIDVLSCPDAIARAMKDALGQSYEPAEIDSINKCPDCGYSLRRESGCKVCDNCGYSKCG